MSRLLPIDLVNAQLPVGLRGYKQEEVDALLDKAAHALEDLSTENDELRGQIARLRSELDALRQEERLVKEAILSAQRAADGLRADAQREADLIREEARQQARAERSQAQHDAENLRDEVERLQALRKRYLADHRALLEREMRELEELASIPVATSTPAPLQASAPAQAVVPAPMETPSQPYPTRLPADTKPLEPILVEGGGESWED